MDAQISRRRFLSLSAVGLTAPQLLALRGGTASAAVGSGGRARSCIVLFCWGGVSHLDTFDLKPDAESGIRGEFRPIETAVPGIRISEHLPLLARQARHLAIVRSVHHEASDHRKAAYWNLTGHRPETLGPDPVLPSRRDWPSIGAQVAWARRDPARENAYFRRRASERSREVADESIELQSTGTASPGRTPLERGPVRVLREVSLSTDVLGRGRFPIGHTNGSTVALIGRVAVSSASSTALTRNPDGPVADFSRYVAGDSTAGDWGSDTHGRGGNLYLPGAGEPDAPHAGFGAHANKFITFDLAAIRARHFDGASGPLRLTGRVGVNGAPGVPPSAAIQAGVWVDGEPVDVSDEIPRDARPHELRLYLGDAHRTLTLAMLNGPHSTHYDDIAFRDVRLALVDGDVAIAQPLEDRVEEELEPSRVSEEVAPALPRSVSIPYPIADRGLQNGQDGGFLGPRFDPALVHPGRGIPYRGVSPLSGHFDLGLKGVSSGRFAARRRLLGLLDDAREAELGAAVDARRPFVRSREQALDMLTSPAVQEAFDLRREPRRLREAYGPHICGQGALLARRLTEAGVPLVTVFCSVGDLNGAQGDNWDTHGNNFARLKNDMLPPLDRAGAALLADLHDRGRLDETLVVFLTEFGRTPKINGGGGRDHFPNCYSVAFAGGGVRGGQVYGRSDATGSAPADAPCTPEDIHATIFHALGIDPHTVVTDLEGRPFPLTDGSPLPIL